MTDVWFYQLGSMGLDRALPEILEKIIDNQWRAYVHCLDQDTILQLDNHLWTYRPASFLAHGCEGDAFSCMQPVLLGVSGDMINRPDVYISISPTKWPDVEGLRRVLIMFDGADEGHLIWARQAWKEFKSTDNSMAYWQQDGLGKWSKTL